MPKSKSSSNSPAQTVPIKVVIGVTGHRKLNAQHELIEAIQKAIDKIRQIILLSHKGPLVISMLSPLAEGADRLIAREVLKIPGSILEVVLPLKKEDYMQDFQTSESKRQFKELLSQAKSIKRLPAKRSRTEAYEQVGRYVVDHCDILIVIWDGKPAAGQGGTAEIVEYARKKNCPLIWIHTEVPVDVTFEF